MPISNKQFKTAMKMLADLIARSSDSRSPSLMYRAQREFNVYIDSISDEDVGIQIAQMLGEDSEVDPPEMFEDEREAGDGHDEFS